MFFFLLPNFRESHTFLDVRRFGYPFGLGSTRARVAGGNVSVFVVVVVVFDHFPLLCPAKNCNEI